MTQITHSTREHRGLVLQASVYSPPGIPRGAVLLNHGFGSNRIEWGLFPLLGRALAEAGLCCIAFDRAGQGESEGSFRDLSVEDEVVQVTEWVDDLVTMDAPIHLVGMSMGGVLASVAAARRAEHVASLTLLSPAAVFRDEISSGRLQGRSVDIPEDAYFDFMGAPLGRPYLREAVAFDPYAQAAGYRGPVRILHGSADLIVPVSYAERYLDVYGESCRLTVREGADHGFATVPDREFVRNEVVAFITSMGGPTA